MIQWISRFTRPPLGLILPLAAFANAFCQPAIVTVVNSASFQTAGLPVEGGLATMYVSGLTALKPGAYLAQPSQPLPYTLGGATVVMNNDYAPLLAVIVPSDPTANVQINFQVPLSANASQLARYVPSLSGYFGGEGNAPPGYSGYLGVTDGVNYATITATTAPPAIGAFFSTTDGYVVALHASDSSPVTPQNPAHRGESIIAYADGFFLTWPRPPIGIPVPAHVKFQPDASLIAIGSLYLQAPPTFFTNCAPFPGYCNMQGYFPGTPPLTINSMGLQEGTVGVETINFVVPANQRPGVWDLFFDIVTSTPFMTTGVASSNAMLPVD